MTGRHDDSENLPWETSAPNHDLQPASDHPQFASRNSQRLPGWDVLLLVVLTFAQLQITSLAESAVLPTLRQDVLRHPWLGGWLSPAAITAFGEVGPRPGEPIGLLLIALALGFVALYALIDLFQSPISNLHSPLPPSPPILRLKWILLVGVIACTIFLPALKMILLRQQSGPASYTHDGGVIQTEATIQFLLAGKNPYREDYTQTPMAEWGFSQYRTALYHYPYLPWTFVFSAPFYLIGQAIGGYDQRFVYLALMAIALALAPRLVTGERQKLALVALLALNPLMGLDLVFGQNDSFILCWIVFGLVGIQSGRVAGGRWQSGRGVLEQSGTINHQKPGVSSRSPISGLQSPSVASQFAIFCFGLACASKPTAWFMAPFFGLLLVADQPLSGWLDLARTVPLMIRRAVWALIPFALLLLPYVSWDGWALYDDVWRWSNGQGETGYQIWGWGASNFVLALGGVVDRFAAWPFQLLELALALPVLFWFLYRQMRHNTIGNACWHYGLFLLIFFYGSRFLNENYLGYSLAFLAIGVLSRDEE